MLRNAMYGFVLVVSVLMAGAVFAAETPTLHQIYEAAQAGRLNEAQGMIQQVLKEHPNSAKAHYVDAEILAKSGHLAEAREELNTAERLEPGLPFVKPEAVQELKAKVGEAHSGSLPVTTSQASFPWGWLFLGIGAIVVITFIMRALARPNVSPTTYPANYQGNYQPGMSPAGGSYAPAVPSAPGMGSGIMSGLATGAALGAGMVAGEALAHHFMDGNRGDANQPQPLASAGNDLGGSDFGVADNSSWDDNSSVADISGGDDWS
ncbi:MAG TPA: tetratricopeptide repeat protein [Gallionellaceae bacterium]|nr:tetratricopeptide repeat protein [Gallionellaceae bacterium]